MVSTEYHYTGRYLALQANIKLEWNCLTVDNIVVLITSEKSFVELAFGQNKKNIFVFQNREKEKSCDMMSELKKKTLFFVTDSETN
jgi:hypothetical protein